MICLCGCGEECTAGKQWRHGHIARVRHWHSGRSRPVIERFWESVNKTDGCWFWTRSVMHGGYGSFKVRSKTNIRAHRFSWELVNGPVADGLWVLHKCDTPRCVRPDHLFLGTPKDNIADAVRKGRMASVRNGRHNSIVRPDCIQRGQKNAAARLTDKNVLEIRQLVITVPSRTLARRFGVTQSMIRQIARRDAWKHLT